MGLPMKVSSSKIIKFVKSVARQAGRLPEYSSKFSRKDYTMRQHVVLLCLKVKLKQRYREFCEIVALMPDLCGLIGLGKIPHWVLSTRRFFG